MLVAAATVAGCDLLDVNNPNNVSEEALSNPAAAAPEVSGAVGSVVRAVNSLLGSYSTATDELIWQGSREAYNVLDQGTVRDRNNEFVDASDFYVNEARWLANRTVGRLEAFDKDGKLTDRSLLSRANLYDAIIYDFIANTHDDFVISSDRTQAGTPVGPANMVTLYDSAVAATTRGLTIATAVADEDLRIENLMVRARAKFDKAIWLKLNPSKSTAPANPLVNDAGADADAAAALAITGSRAYVLYLNVPSANLVDGAVSLTSNVNTRQEMRINAIYGVRTAGGSANLLDPVTGAKDAALDAIIKEFVLGVGLSPTRYTSAVEMWLIRAEVALANGSTTPGSSFGTYINNARALAGKPAWAGTPSALNILKHERMADLFLRGVRLNDMYRFGIISTEWRPGSDALICPGSLFPITVTERQSNSKVTLEPACGQ